MVKLSNQQLKFLQRSFQLCNRWEAGCMYMCCKGKMYKSVVRPAMLYGMEMVAVTERQVGKMEVAELKMVRWALGVTRKDKIRNKYLRGTAKITKLGDKL